MLSNLILAAAIITQAQMTPRQRQEYMAREGFVHAKESPRMKALARKYDAWNRRYARNVHEMRFTIFSGIRYARAHPPIPH